MKNLSTGTGLALLAGAIVAYPFASSLAPNASAVGVGTTAVTAVAAAATAQAGPTIVWYGSDSFSFGFNGHSYSISVLNRAWSDGRVETKWTWAELRNGAGQMTVCTPTLLCSSPWVVVSDPAQGLTFDADLNFDEAVDGVDLGMMLAKWGPAPRNPVPPSDCPLALINP
jgi:hypothetical protein